MRYKFKAWDKHNKKWYDRVLCGCDSDGLDYVCNLVWMDEIGDWTHFDEGCGTIVQWTGLKDRNGVETAHKDIVEFEGTTYVIEWSEEDTGFFLAHLKYLDDLENEEHLRGRCIRESEILGNVYEHPHLLPKEDE